MSYDPEIDPTVAGAIPEPPATRKEALRYVSFKSLLASSRAIKKSGHDLILQFAGDEGDIQRVGGKRKRRVRYLTGKDAKRGQAFMLAEVRRAKTDHQYNQILVTILVAIGKAGQRNIAQKVRVPNDATVQ